MNKEFIYCKQRKVAIDRLNRLINETRQYLTVCVLTKN